MKEQLNQLQPRIRGQAYQKENQAWGWEIVITFGDMSVDDPEALCVGQHKKDFLTKESAIDDMRKASVDISEKIAEAMGGGKPEGYMDLTKGFKIETKEQFLNKSPFGKKFF